MIVVAIMAIVMTMSVPIVYKTWRKAPMRKAVSDVVEVCSHARARAIMQGVMTEVDIYPKENRLGLGGAASPPRSSGEGGAAHEISGPAARLHEADLTNRRVVLNLESVLRPGERTFTIERRNIDLPAGLSLVRAIPAQVRIAFERSVSASVPVRVRIAVPPPEGYRVARQQALPNALRIVGPESRVRQVESVDADPIDLSRTVGKARFQVHAFVADPQVRFVSSPLVEVSVSLEKTVPGGAPSSGSPTVRN